MGVFERNVRDLRFERGRLYCWEGLEIEEVERSSLTSVMRHGRARMA
jgi:hypothetical protein